MKPLIVANWKMNPQSLAEAKKLFDSVKRGVKNIKKAEVVICPPFLYLKELKEPSSLKKNSVPLVGAQDVFWEKSGADTGEISPSMLKDMGCQYVIVGHSERRRYFSETDEVVNKKLKSVIEARMTPILCVGETQNQRDKGETENILRKQIEKALNDISKLKISPYGRSPEGRQNSKLIIAYEPIWAIGTKNPCSVDDTLTVILFIRKIISRILTKKAAKKIRILYGGSVDSNNAKDYLKEEEMNGLLVGGASLNSKEFLNILKIAGNH